MSKKNRANKSVTRTSASRLGEFEARQEHRRKTEEGVERIKLLKNLQGLGLRKGKGIRSEFKNTPTANPYFPIGTVLHLFVMTPRGKTLDITDIYCGDKGEDAIVLQHVGELPRSWIISIQGSSIKYITPATMEACANCKAWVTELAA